MEQNIIENPIKSVDNRQPDGTFGPGNVANPNGRPKGKSLKEYWKQKFSDMTDKQKERFTKKISPELLWKMAEGNPENKTDLTSDGEKLQPILVKFIDGNENNSNTNGIQKII